MKKNYADQVVMDASITFRICNFTFCLAFARAIWTIAFCSRDISPAIYARTYLDLESRRKKKKGMIDSLVRPERKGAVSTSLAQHVIAPSCGKIGTGGVTRVAVNPSFFLSSFCEVSLFLASTTSSA